MLDDLGAEDLQSIIREDDWATRAAFRKAFRQSMFLVTKVLVGYNEPRNLMSAEVFKERSDWIQWVVTEKKRGLLEDPRSFIKSTACSRTIPIWVAMQRTNEVHDHPIEVERVAAFLAAHPHIRGVDTRICLICDSKENSARFGGSVKQIIDTNPLLAWAYPELLWANPRRVDYGSYTDEEFSLPGRFDPTARDAFLRAAGIETKITSGRAEIVLINDLVGDNNWKSSGEIGKRIDYLSTAPALLENRDPSSPYGGVVVVEGNRWSLDDMNSRIHDEFSDWAIWRRGVYRCYTHGLGNCGRWGSEAAHDCAPTQESLWKERYPDAESLKRLEQDVASPEVWAAQYLNDPTSASDLDVTHIVDFDIRVGTWVDPTTGYVSRGNIVAFEVDGKRETIPVEALSQHVISVDVASSTDPRACRTAASWFAVDKLTGRHLWLDCRADRWAPDVAVTQALDLWEEIQRATGVAPRFLVEKVAAQTYFATSLQYLAKRRGTRIGTVELIPPTRGVAKEDRNRRALGNLMGQRRLLVRAGLQLPRMEIRHFPTGSMDTLDSATQAILYYQDKLGGGASHERLRKGRARQRAQRLALSDATGAPIA